MTSHKKLLVCDLDNTLYDWVGYFVPAFYSMVDVAAKISSCSIDVLLDDLKKVHQRFHDSEHPFSLLEADCIKKRYATLSRAQIAEELDPAFHAFNAVRKKQLKPYPQVIETLEMLSRSNIVMVAHTESKLHGVVDRLSRLDLHKYFNKIYCRERSVDSHPTKDASNWFADFPMNKIIELSHHQAKPSAEVLLEICAKENVVPQNVLYVGDSISKDIMMAKQASVFAIWAKYGTIHEHGAYEKLVRVSHWTPAEVEREKILREKAKDFTPDFVASSSFAEVAAGLEYYMAHSTQVTR